MCCWKSDFREKYLLPYNTCLKHLIQPNKYHSNFDKFWKLREETRCCCSNAKLVIVLFLYLLLLLPQAELPLLEVEELLLALLAPSLSLLPCPGEVHLLLHHGLHLEELPVLLGLLLLPGQETRRQTRRQTPIAQISHKQTVSYFPTSYKKQQLRGGFFRICLRI